MRPSWGRFKIWVLGLRFRFAMYVSDFRMGSRLGQLLLARPTPVGILNGRVSLADPETKY